MTTGDFTSHGWQTLSPTQVHDYVDALDAGALRTASHRRKGIELLDVAPGTVALDIGCGAGDVVVELARSGAVAIGLDRSMDLLTVAAERLGQAGVTATLLRARAEAIPLVTGSVSAIHCTRVLMHLDVPEDALADMTRVLIAGGRLVVTEPDWASLDVDSGDRELDEFVRDRFAAGVRQPDLGRRLLTLVSSTGYEAPTPSVERVRRTGVVEVDPRGVLDGLIVEAVEWGQVDDAQAEQWRAVLDEPDADRAVTTTLTVHRVAAVRTARA